MIEDLTGDEYNTLLRQDFGTFAVRCFHDLNPQAELAELASRGHRGQARRRTRGQDPAADHQPAAAPPEIADSLDRLSSLVSGA
jgi:hypothetical protein